MFRTCETDYKLLIFTDGRRECLEQTYVSASASLPAPSGVVIVNDCVEDRSYNDWINYEVAPDLEHAFDCVVTVLPPQYKRRGFGGAINAAWSEVAAHDGYIFHLEDDFLFNEPVDIDLMARILNRRYYLCQVALLRQPWSSEERAAGGIMQKDPDDYEGLWAHELGDWVEHRRFFTTNPSLYHSSITRDGWPTTQGSEGEFSRILFADPHVKSAFLGKKFDDPRVTHIGANRVGSGY